MTKPKDHPLYPTMTTDEFIAYIKRQSAYYELTRWKPVGGGVNGDRHSYDFVAWREYPDEETT